MQKSVKAIYEDGVFKPLSKPDIEEHQNVDLFVVVPESDITPLSVQRVINFLKEGPFPKRSIDEMMNDTEVDFD